MPDSYAGDPVAEALSAAGQVHAAGVSTYVVGIESHGQNGGLDSSVLASIASDPDAQHLSLIGNYSALLGALTSLGQQLCAPDVEITNTLVSDSTVPVGGTATTELRVTNSGDTALANVELDLTWPAGPIALASSVATYVNGAPGVACGAVAPHPADPSLEVVRCVLPDLGSGDSTTFQLTFDALEETPSVADCANVTAVDVESGAAVSAGPACTVITIIARTPAGKPSGPGTPTTPTTPTSPTTPSVPVTPSAPAIPTEGVQGAPQPPSGAAPPPAEAPELPGTSADGPADPLGTPGAIEPGAPTGGPPPNGLVPLPEDKLPPPAQDGVPPPGSTGQAPPPQESPAAPTPPDTGHGVFANGDSTDGSWVYAIPLAVAVLALTSVSRRRLSPSRLRS